MRKLLLFTLLAGATVACQDAISPSALGGPALSSEASDRAHLDLREERASLIAAGNAVSAAIAQDGIVQALGDALAADALFLSPRMPVLQGRAAAIDFLSTNPIAPSDMQWEVIAADVSNDGTQGYTWAQGTSTLNFGAGPITPPTFFLLYWRRTAGGDWQIAALVFNLGGPQPLPLPDGFGTPEQQAPSQLPQHRGRGAARRIARGGRGLLGGVGESEARARPSSLRGAERDRGRRANVRLRAGRHRRGLRRGSQRRRELDPPLLGCRGERRPGILGRRGDLRPGGASLSSPST